MTNHENDRFLQPQGCVGSTIAASHTVFYGHALGLSTHLLRPNLWVMLMDSPTAFHNGMRAIAEELVGPVLCVWNKGLPDPSDTSPLRVPEALAGRVTFADVRIPRRPELDMLPGCVWASDPDSPGARETLQLVSEILARVGVHPPGAPPPQNLPKILGSASRGIHRDYPAREAAALAGIMAGLGQGQRYPEETRRRPVRRRQVRRPRPVA